MRSIQLSLPVLLLFIHKNPDFHNYIQIKKTGGLICSLTERVKWVVQFFSWNWRPQLAESVSSVKVLTRLFIEIQVSLTLHDFPVFPSISPSPQCLHAMETHVIINFLPTVLMQLFEVLTAATKEGHEIAVNSLRSVVHLCGLYYLILIKKKKNASGITLPCSVPSAWSYI